MNPQDAGRVVAVLNAGFPRDALEPESVVLFVNEVALLSDPDAALEAAYSCVRGGDHFPTLKELRSTYRAIAERRESEERARVLALEQGDRIPVPEWVYVWWWASRDRDPAEKRPFPQSEPNDPDALTAAEYQALLDEWRRAGAPKFGSFAAVAASVLPGQQD